MLTAPIPPEHQPFSQYSLLYNRTTVVPASFSPPVFRRRLREPIMMQRLRLAAFLIILAGSALISGQTPASPAQQQPTFKTRVEYVEVDAIVTDSQGNFVRDLTREDFKVFEDGKAQTISTFSIVDIPVER